MSRIRRDFTDCSEAWYTIAVEENKVFMDMDSIEYLCRECGKSEYIDLSIVPPSDIPVDCSACGHGVLNLEEDDFRIELVPVDEVYDHIGVFYAD